MPIKILVIGDIGNIFSTLKKFTNTQIHIVNFPKDGPGIFTYSEDYELFNNSKILDQVKKINKIKNDFDFCITMGMGEVIAYLADLNYASLYVGRDIDAPRFIKNSTEEWYTKPLHKLNFLERRFFYKTFNSAVIHVGGRWITKYLKKYSKKFLRFDRVTIDSTLFHPKIKSVNIKKTKFTFFCPQRMGLPKGTDILWKALKYCKSDFDILQVNWSDQTTFEEKDIAFRLKQQIPKQVKLIPMIKRDEINAYYVLADTVIGNLRLGTFENIELESIFCQTPVINYTNRSIKLILDGNQIESPFLPTSNEPIEIAKIIDKIVESETFRKELLEKETKFVQEIANVVKNAKWWDSFFEKIVTEHKTIHKNSSKFSLKFDLVLFLIGNRMHLNKILKFLKR
jgi:hypothetical protein